jgi:hypothetical protein
MHKLWPVGLGAVLLASAGCAHRSDTKTLVIHDTFTQCVTPNLDRYFNGAAHCNPGDREGLVCVLPDGKKEYAGDQAAFDSCEKRGGHTE